MKKIGVGVLLFTAVLLLAAGRLQNRVLFFSDHTVIRIISGSMEPTIESNSCILLEQIDPSRIRVGDVITFYSQDPALQGKRNTHRVVGISSDGAFFQTQGDNNTIPDQYQVPKENVVGRYQKELPLFTALARFLLPYGIWILSPCLFLPFLHDLLYRRKKRR